FEAAGEAANSVINRFLQQGKKEWQAIAGEQERVRDELKQMQEQIATFDMAPIDKMLYDFKQLPGVTQNAIEAAQRFGMTLKGLAVDQELEDFFDFKGFDTKIAALQKKLQ